MRGACFSLFVVAVVIAACAPSTDNGRNGSPNGEGSASDAIEQFEQFERDLERAVTSEDEAEAFGRWNGWLLKRNGSVPGFLVSWEDDDGVPINHADVEKWIETNPEDRLWVRMTCTSGDESRTFRHRLVDSQNWYLPTLNE